MVGKSLGHYEIVAPLGSGGMGEVYRARDANLKRDVAIKVLPEDLSGDPDRLARLEREAHLLAALNHSNIASIYSLEEVEGTRFLVMELVKGDSLEQMLAAGALPVEDALDICRQIAEALEAAHAEGIIHRDLKPANVVVTPEGQAKVLDFGLAKAVESMPSDTDMSHSPTITIAATQVGVIMGTAPYMSPEQVRGKSLDKRADIWAFGCVLFEALVGHKAFARETVADTLAAVLEVEPPWGELPAATPPALKQLIGRCLRKNLKRRLHDVADARIEIEEALEPAVGWAGPGGGVAGGGDSTVGWSPATRAVAVVIAAVAVIAGGLAVWFATQPEPEPIQNWDIVSPGLEGFSDARIAISPDGSRIVFGASNQLWVRDEGDPEATPIRYTDDGRAPFFSPDGGQLGFVADGKIQRVGFAGAAPTEIARSGMGTASWNKDGMIYYSRGARGIWKVSAEGGDPEQIIALNDSEWAYGAELLPGGEWVLFTLGNVLNYWTNASIVAESLVTRQRKELIQPGVAGRYVPTGHIVYLNDGTLFAVSFDQRSVEALSAPVPVVNGVQHAHNLVTPGYSFSESGRFVYRPGQFRTDKKHLMWTDRDGNTERLPIEPRPFYRPRPSPDASRIAVAAYGEGDDAPKRFVWIYEIESGAGFKLHDESFAGHPVWHPDSQSVYFSCCAEGEADIWRGLVDQSERPQLVFGDDGQQLPHSVSTDGTVMLFWSGSGPWSSWRLPLEGDLVPTLLTDLEKNADYPAISPDGRYFAFQSDDSGSMQIYVQELSSTPRRVAITTDGGANAVWSRESGEIFYSNDGKIYTVEVTTVPEFSKQLPRLLIDLPGNAYGDFGVSADGQSFLHVEPQPPTTRYLRVIESWFRDLSEKVPLGTRR